VCAGDTVYISAGTYQLTSQISIRRSGISLKGAPGTSPENVILQGGPGFWILSVGPPNANPGFTFTVEGLTLAGVDGGLAFNASSSGSGTLTVRNVVSKNNPVGIYISNMS
jgi:hypothetical protein